jgi:hypothetical protein
MQEALPPSYSDLLSHAEKTAADVLKRSAAILDQRFGIDYAKKNPELLKHVSQLIFTEFGILRAHHGARK